MSLLQTRLSALQGALSAANLAGIKRGIEKESLRVTTQGMLAQTPHPTKLGSALTHPEITTDYSEALLEFITPPATRIDEVLSSLDNIHRYAYQHIGDEMLWVNSMPCALTRDADIPVGQYGRSNIGQMKTIYRLGLGHRYGRFMQAIAGIHYNFSLPDDFWRFLHDHEQSKVPLQEFKNARYFDLIRNFRRYFWLLLYLFGAAPAVCKSFVAQRPHTLVPFDDDSHSLHTPYATSLRMGDLGYQSTAQQSLFVCYNNVQSYISALCKAITTPYAAYEKIGLKDSNGNYQQLNTGILQIENEFYSPIRPKRTAELGETALRALFARGVEYIEVRCLDLNPFHPLGIDADQMRFLDTFLLYCLLKDSPPSSLQEYARIQENQQRMVYHGRDPKLLLLNSADERPFSDWSAQVLANMRGVAELLDQANASTAHQESLAKQQQKLADAALTPSSRVLTIMREKDLSFFQFALQQAQQFAHDFRAQPMDQALQDKFANVARASIEEQQQIEQSDHLEFETYLTQFYAQYQCGEALDCP